MDAKPDLRLLLQKLTSNTLSAEEAATLRALYEANQLVVANSQGLAVGGDLANSTVITGDGNITINVNPDALSQLLETLSSGPRPNGGKSVFAVPLSSNPAFVGREQDLETLAGMLDRTRRVALTGPGGMGKTQLAAEFAHGNRTRYPGGIFWLSMDNPDSIKTQIAEFAKPRYLNLWRVARVNLDEQVDEVRAVWEDPPRCLLIFDNCESPEVLKTWCPISKNADILLTSRRQSWPNSSGLHELHLSELPRAASCRLLLSGRAAAWGMTVEQLLQEAATARTAVAICAEVGDLPLAIALIAAYLEDHPDRSLDTYFDQLRTRLVTHPSLNGNAVLDLPNKKRAPSIIATFGLSYDRLDQDVESDLLARTIIKRIAYCAPEPVPQDLLFRLAEIDIADEDARDRVETALRRLMSLGLLERLPDRSGRLHRLLAGYIRTQVTVAEATQGFVAQCLTEALDVAVQAGYSQVGTPLPTHARYMLEHMDPTRAETAHFMTRLARLLMRQGDYNAARPYLEKALTIYEHLKTPTDISRSLNNLAEVLVAQGDYGKARTLLERALTLDNTQDSLAASVSALSLTNLATLSYSQGDYQTAAALYQQALEKQQQILKPSDPELAANLANLGTVLAAQGRYAEARPLLEQALALREARWKQPHPETTSSLNALAVLLMAEGEYQKADELLSRALAIRKEGASLFYPEYASSLHNLATLRMIQGNYAGAQPLYKEALSVTEQVFGSIHPSTASILDNLAELSRLRGNNDTAQPLYERALQIRRQALGPDHPDTARSLNNLAALYYAKTNYADAQPLYEEALHIRERVLGPDHPLTATSMNNLATLLVAVGDYDRARSLYDRALELRRRILGDTHPDTATSLNNLATLLVAQGAYDEAYALFQQALGIYEQTLGVMHPQTAECLSNLSGVLHFQGRLTEAAELYQKAFDMRTQMFGRRHQYTAASMNNLGLVMLGRGDLARAHELIVRAYNICQETLDSEDLAVAVGSNNLGLLLQQEQEWPEAVPCYQQALAISEKRLGPDHRITAIIRTNLEQLRLLLLIQAAGGSGITMPNTPVSLDTAGQSPPAASAAQSAASSQRSEVFISYSHKDKRWLEQLKTHLKPLVRQGTITVWDDTKIRPGTQWEEEIRAALGRTQVAVLLVTPDFLASDFITNTELPALLAAAQQEGLRILWIAVRPSNYKISPIAVYQAANDPARPLSQLSKPQQEQTFVLVSEIIAGAYQA